ncbi:MULTISPECIES: DUF4142 domain-containing protein [Streptomyces]|uniref:DUF4142 domain-containing protein n=1 Tax=Streptomyces katrae TaxID=68223 RepID=A0ABT7GYT1_9ACTN|nr:MULTISPECIES: DUF4142 domain-containing protein [Streptomyces]MDK9498790.1 DUF4142 domain-containing protein [Streptomyces katrae]RST00540.1 DUF4142 domain-containing protein [Streptomyces sp. WAC07149]GLX17509.1 hypothetical protein Slala01_11530 [Streptomyces lavendulae subsp. lavendulae]GLX24630.1 hypothetical protein Slala02_04500 [Streptomyces lavendulae subsp. lavendulae]
MLSLRRRSVSGLSVATRYTIGSGLVISALAVTLIALLIPVSKFGDRASAAAAGTAAKPGTEDDGAGTMSTAYGPLTAADRDFVRKVRLAGLWELPAGRQAQQRGTRPSVRTAGMHLVDGHTELDRQVLQVGQALGMDLPDKPSAQQQEWLNQLTNASNAEYERLFVQLLRRAHGKVFALLAQIRAQTRNSMVRSLATSANATVLDHITVLEESGLVDFDSVSDASPAPASPAPVHHQGAAPPQMSDRRYEVK